MEPRYVLILDLSTIEEKYGFRLSNCQWMTTEELNICRYENGREVEDYA